MALALALLLDCYGYAYGLCKLALKVVVTVIFIGYTLSMSVKSVVFYIHFCWRLWDIGKGNMSDSIRYRFRSISSVSRLYQ